MATNIRTSELKLEVMERARDILYNRTGIHQPPSISTHDLPVANVKVRLLIFLEKCLSDCNPAMNQARLL